MSGKMICFLITILTILVQVSGWFDTYKAAVLEYHPVKKENDILTLNANVNNYVEYIKRASEKKADIIVFPESGLFSQIPHPIPDPTDNIIPCDSTKFNTTQAVKDLSCASKNNKIYSVINLLENRKCEPGDEDCPSEGHYYSLNTNVVFDRNGMVIARYSKYNLYDENVDRLKEPEIVFFDTDFGVRFGTFICFDILFPFPALQLHQQYGITDFVFTTFWFSEAPFLTALQAQRGWAEANNVNLLASGINYPTLGSAGSGIYNGKYGHIKQTMPEKNVTQLLIANVPKIKSSVESSVHQYETPALSEKSQNSYNSTNLYFSASNKVTDSEELGLTLLKDQMKLFSSEIISQNKAEFHQQICSHKDFCCEFNVVKDALMTDSKNFTIRAVVLNGVRRFGKNFRGGVQVCGVLVCDGPEIMNCTNRIKNLSGVFKFKEITIKGNFNARNALQFPSTLTTSTGLSPLPAYKYEFTKIQKSASASEVSLQLLWPEIDLQAFGIWGRDFTRDMEPQIPESDAARIVSTPILLGAFLGFIFFTR